MLINTGVHIRDMNTETDAIRERMTQEELESAFPDTMKLETELGYTDNLELTVEGERNIVRTIIGYGTILGKNIKDIYISEQRVMVTLVDGRNFSFPIKGGIYER